MGKHGDPLRAQARISGVKKSHRTHKDSRTLPSWYYRVLNISEKENRDVMGFDFDEDLSEIEDCKGRRSDDVDQSKNEGCCIEDVDMDEDDESERSYDGFDADLYYAMKNERKERKREKQQERKEKEQQREFEREMEEEVHATERTLYQARKKRNATSIESLTGQSFHLFCSAHVDHFYTQDFYANKTVNFYYPYNEDDYSLDKPKLDEESGLLYGYVYLDPWAGCEFGPFRPPKYASRKATKVKSLDGKYDLSFTFVGNGHLKLRVSKDMVFMDEYNASPRAPPPAAPKVFEFFGISSDREKEEVERQERIAKTHRSPSPGEN